MSMLREHDYTTMPGAGVSTNHIFQVTIFPGIPAVGMNVLPTTWLGAFKKVSGFGRDMQVEAVSEGGYNHAVRTLWKGPSKHGEITLESGSVGMNELWGWARRVDAGAIFRTMVFIEQFATAAASEPVRTYTLLNAWPVRWKGADLDAHSAAVAIDSLTLAYDDLIVDNNALELLRGIDLVRGTLTAEDTGSSVTVQFNPANVKLARSLSWGNHQTSTEVGTGKSAKTITTTTSKGEYPVLKAPDFSPDTLTLGELIFDASESLTNAAMTATLQQLHAMSLHTVVTGSTRRPPLVRFVWGSINFLGGISSLNMDHTLFDASGGVRRAKVSLTLTGQLIGGVPETIDVNPR